MATKKVGSSGKYGPRYGRRSKKVSASIEAKLKQKHECPNCERKTLRRITAGIWECRKCKLKTIGGAYQPKTPKR